MSKITFRADDELVRRLEAFDASKSEVMRDALRSYLDEAERDADTDPQSADTIDGALSDRVDELVRKRVDAVVEERVDDYLATTPRAATPRGVNINVTVDGDDPLEPSAHDGTVESTATQSERKTADIDEGGDPVETQSTCDQCGETVDSDHVYCPNCGEKASHRVFCDCGDEIRSDWAFCPSCGRRTPAADVL